MEKRLLASIALGFGLAFSGTAHAQIKLGIGAPITGPNASFGAQLKNGAEQAIEDINAAGGVLDEEQVPGAGIVISDRGDEPYRKMGGGFGGRETTDLFDARQLVDRFRADQSRRGCAREQGQDEESEQGGSHGFSRRRRPRLNRQTGWYSSRAQGL